MTSKRIFLDPGHGYGDPGAIANGLQEAERAFLLAHSVRDFLVRRHSNEYQVLMTPDVFRPEIWDRALPLEARPEVARWWGADLFVSLHFDRASTPDPHGPHIIIYNQASSGPAKKMLQALGSDSKWSRVHPANMAVLRVAAGFTKPPMPAILIEGGFLTNEAEADLIRGPELVNLALRISLGVRMIFS